MWAELHSELDRFRVAWGSGLAHDVEPISLEAVEEGLHFLQAITIWGKEYPLSLQGDDAQHVSADQVSELW